MKKTFQILLILTLALSLGACSLTTTPTQAPTADIGPTLDAARTQAAATVAAELASQPTATSLPATATLAPSATPLPTNTEVPTSVALPTNTPLPPTKTPVPTLPVVLITNTPTGYSCSITASSGGGEQKAGADFDGRWTLKNVGSNKWLAAALDYKFSSGTKLQKKADTFDLPTDVAVGSSIDIIVDMTAPTTPGVYTSNWVLADGSTIICGMSVQITVK